MQTGGGCVRHPPPAPSHHSPTPTQLYSLSRPDFITEVTEASRESAVVLLLYRDSIPDSLALTAILRTLAAAHPATKFMRIISDQCIEGFPDSKVPTMFVYRGGEVVANIVGVATLGGKRPTVEAVEWVLGKAGALTCELEADPRPEEQRERGEGMGGGRDWRRRGSGGSDES